MEQLLTYGLFEGELKHVSEVENGLACNCFCPNCMHPLIAKNNFSNIKVAHFAHKSDKECEGAVESALHLLAKSILQRTKRLTIPSYHYDYNPNNKNSIFRESVILTFDTIILEKTIFVEETKIIPDAIGFIKKKQIFIEFARTHFLDDFKIEMIRGMGIPCIEIDLREQLLDENSLTNFLNSDNPSIYWILDTRSDQDYIEHKKDSIRKQIEQNKIDFENNKKEVEAKYFKYKDDLNGKLIRTEKGVASSCPLRKFEISKLAQSKYYEHSVLKNIIDGEFWNGQLYGTLPNEKWIELGEEKLVVIPKDSNTGALSEQEIKSNNLFYEGLRKIKSILDDPFYGICYQCEFSEDKCEYGGNSYVVCSFAI